MDELLLEFKDESLNLLEQMREILEHVEDQPQDGQQMELFGQLVDRIMGGAKSLALNLPKEHPMHSIGTFGEICKILGYKSSQLKANNQLLLTTVAFLFDAVEAMEGLVNSASREQVTLDAKLNQMNQTFLDRLRWIAKQFDEGLRATVALDKVQPKQKEDTQYQIQNLLKTMGLSGTRHDS